METSATCNLCTATWNNILPPILLIQYVHESFEDGNQTSDMHSQQSWLAFRAFKAGTATCTGKNEDSLLINSTTRSAEEAPNDQILVSHNPR